MRFPADDIWKVRLGEQTRLTIPWERKRCPFQVDGCYVLERMVDVATTHDPCGVCKGTGGKLKRCEKCGGHGSWVSYVTRSERVEGAARLRVLTVEKLRPGALSDVQALQEGFESAEEWLDAFSATHGDCEWAWSVTFELTHDVMQFMARQSGILDAPQYVSTTARALDDADAPTAADYRVWSEAAETEQRRQEAIRKLERRIEALKRKAA